MEDDRPLDPRAACTYLREHCGISHTVATLAKLRSVGGGPLYQKFGRRVRYMPKRLREYSLTKISKELRSTSDY